MMTNAESPFTRKEIVILVVLSLLSMGLITIAVIPQLRDSAKSLFAFDHRQIIAKVTGLLAPQGPHIMVLKTQDRNSLALEIYEQGANQEMTLLQKIPLQESHDGYVSLKGNATNLALTDTDGDNVMEIVTPTFDEQLIPRLNVFKYNSLTKSFSKISAPPMSN